MIEFILETSFMQRGLLAGIIVALLCPLIGSFIVVRRLSLISEALSHVTLAGIGFGIMLSHLVLWAAGIDPLYIGMLFAVCGALFVEKLRTVFRHFQDVSVPIVLSAGTGFGVIFINISEGFSHELFNILFGNLFGVMREDMLFIIITSALVILMCIVFYQPLFSLTFDEEFARISGLPSRGLNVLFAILIAVTITVSMRVLGILLVSSLLVLPVAAALRLAKSFKQLIAYAIILAEIAMIGGVFLAHYVNVSASGMVVMLAVFEVLIITAAQDVQEKMRMKGASS